MGHAYSRASFLVFGRCIGLSKACRFSSATDVRKHTWHRSTVARLMQQGINPPARGLNQMNAGCVGVLMRA
jgi:hypothetical protein